MGKSNTNLCKTCNQVETLVHFFGKDCKQVKRLWEHIEGHLSVQTNNTICFTNQDILFGFRVTQLYEYKMVNTIIMLAKLAISKYKYGKYANLQLLFEQECSIRKVVYNV